jgi:hypothetical protein
MSLLEVSVTVLYYGLKARILSANTLEGTKTLLEDLKVLKLPHPRREHISTFSADTGPYAGSFGFEFFWPSVPPSGVSTFYQIHPLYFKLQSPFHFSPCTVI